MWLFWGIVASGLSAAYFWKKANPGQSLNPMPTAEDVIKKTSTKP